MTYQVAAFYRFVSLTDLPAVQAAVKAACLENEICGTILLAPEGINGTIAAPSQCQLETMMDVLDHHTGIMQGEVKYSTASEKPFQRLKVRLKKEIITMKCEMADPTKQVGTYVEAKDWNALITDPDVVVIDTRNTYETETGIFKGAIDPETQNFSDFPAFVEKNLDPKIHKKVAMYCTGGIRCEKASSYMLAAGFENVYHLKGGILKYLEEISEEQSQWDGGCFVFDDRAVLGHGLKEI